MVRFDAYVSTAPSLDKALAMSWLYRPGDEVKEGFGRNKWKHRASVIDPSGREVGCIQWGLRGYEHLTMVEVKGERTPEVVGSLRAGTEAHRCTRVDACADFDRPGVFDELFPKVDAIRRAHRVYAEPRGDWELYPEKGRTFDVGAKTSPINARLYEKGKQPEYRHLERVDWVRLEVQVRPQKEAKTTFASLSPLEVWGASKWTRALAAQVLHEHLDPHPPGTVRRLSSRDRALAFMCQQYDRHLVSLAGDLGGWAELGLTLREMVSEQAERRRRAN